MEYKIFKEDGIYNVYSVYRHYGDLVKDDITFSSNSLADCYSWIKAKQEDLIRF